MALPRPESRKFPVLCSKRHYAKLEAETKRERSPRRRPLALLLLISISPHAEHFGNELQPFGWDLPFVHCEMKSRAASLIKMIDESCLMVILKVGMECIINKSDNIEAHKFVVLPKISAFHFASADVKPVWLAVTSTEIAENFIGEQSKSDRIKRLLSDFVTPPPLYLNRELAFAPSQRLRRDGAAAKWNQPDVGSYFYRWRVPNILKFKQDRNVCAASLKESGLAADINIGFYPCSVTCGQCACRNIGTCLGGSSRHPCYDQLPPHNAGLSVVDAPLSKINPGDHNGYKKASDGRQALSIRHPAWFGSGVVLFALIGACAGLALGYLGTSHLCAGRRWSGRLILVIGAVWFMIGAFDIPIAWLFGLIN